MEPTDEGLMLAVRRGELDELGTLFERHHAVLYHFFCRVTGSRTAAEDLVQDVFVRMLKYRSTFRDDSRFTAWMFHIARNARVDHFKKHHAGVPGPEEVAERSSRAPFPGEEMERAEDAALLERALVELHPDKREILLLARYRELKHEDIAGMLGIQRSAVKVRVHRAVKELRDIYWKLSRQKKPCTAKNSETSLRTS